MGFTLYADASDPSEKTNNIPTKNFPMAIKMNAMEIISIRSENGTIDTYPSFKKGSHSKMPKNQEPHERKEIFNS